MPEPQQWREHPPPDEAWKPPTGRSIQEARTEQDHAAGGRERRRTQLGRGRTALASVELKRFAKNRRIYAYLRWQRGGRTVNRYLGEVTGQTRKDNLIQAWNQARDAGLVESD